MAETAKPVDQSDQSAEPNANWDFQDSSAVPTGLEQPPEQQKSVKTVAWTASEYVSHEKGSIWYFQFAGVALLIIGGVGLLTRDLISVIIMVVMAIGVMVFAARKPDTLNYQIDSQGIHIGKKLYPITMFKSFAIVQEGAVKSIMLLPLKRFMPAISVYFAPEDEKKIEDSLGSMLPQEQRTQDRVDRLMHKIRF